MGERKSCKALNCKLLNDILDSSDESDNEKIGISENKGLSPVKLYSTVNTSVSTKRNQKRESDFGDKIIKSKRFDSNGTEIKIENKKKIKVSFIDEARHEPIVRVIFVESYKKYNSNEYTNLEIGIRQKEESCCETVACNLF